MPDIEEMVLAMASLGELEANLQAYLKGSIVRGAILSSDEFINEARISIDTALRVLNKRVQYQNRDMDALIGTENLTLTPLAPFG